MFGENFSIDIGQHISLYPTVITEIQYSRFIRDGFGKVYVLIMVKSISRSKLHRDFNVVWSHDLKIFYYLALD